MCLSDPVHRRPVNEKYCSHLRQEELVRYCNQDVNCAEWAYGEESPVSINANSFLSTYPLNQYKHLASKLTKFYAIKI